MPDLPIVSVIITLYNRERYISDAIRSVLDSDFQQWELIIVDDQSNDASFSVAKSYEKKDRRIRVYQNETNLGDYANRNAAARYAQGTYIKYLDADDLIYPHGLAVMVSAMEKNPGAALGLQIIEREPESPFPILLHPEETYRKHFLRGGLLLSGPSGTIIRRDVFETLNGFLTERHVSDTELWYRIAKEHPVVCLQPALIWWRQHPDQEHVKGRVNPFIIRRRYEINVNAINNNSPLIKDEQLKALSIYKKLYARKVIANAMKFRFGFASILFNSAAFSFKDLRYAFMQSII